MNFDLVLTTCTPRALISAPGYGEEAGGLGPVSVSLWASASLSIQWGWCGEGLRCSPDLRVWDQPLSGPSF